VLQGVTLDLKSIQEETENAVDFTIETNTDEIKTNLENFFEKYNEVLSYIREKSAVDAEAGIRGDLAGDFTFTRIRTNLRLLVANVVSSVEPNNPSLLSQVGIEADDNGELSISDEDELDEFLNENVQKVADLFNSENGVAAKVYDLLTPFTNTGGIIDDNTKILDSRVSGINTRIDNWDLRLSFLEQNYRDQFTKLQQAFVTLSNQQSLIKMISNTVSSYY
jgi:flagellar hook-associated protein 2